MFRNPTWTRAPISGKKARYAFSTLILIVLIAPPIKPADYHLFEPICLGYSKNEKEVLSPTVHYGISSANPRTLFKAL